jgi:hypothetical protein
VSGDHGGLAIAERRYQPQRIPDHIQNAKPGEIAIVIGIPSGCPAVAPLVGRHDAISGGCKRQHHLSPRIGELRKAVQQQDQRPASPLKAGLEHVHVEAIDASHKAGAEPGGQNAIFERSHFRNPPPENQ